MGASEQASTLHSMCLEIVGQLEQSALSYHHHEGLGIELGSDLARAPFPNEPSCWPLKSIFTPETLIDLRCEPVCMRACVHVQRIRM